MDSSRRLMSWRTSSSTNGVASLVAKPHSPNQLHALSSHRWGLDHPATGRFGLCGPSRRYNVALNKAARFKAPPAPSRPQGLQLTLRRWARQRSPVQGKPRLPALEALAAAASATAATSWRQPKDALLQLPLKTACASASVVVRQKHVAQRSA